MESDLPRQLSLLDAVAVVVGTLIGSGVFMAVPLVARQLPSSNAILGIWVVAGLLSFCGALAYAELGAMMPETGGHYVYLREAYGLLVAFLCGWTYFFVVLSGTIAWLAINFTLYLSDFFPLGTGPARIVAVVLIAIVTYVNFRGATAGASAQKIFTLLKVAELLVLIGAAFLVPAVPAKAEAASAIPAGNYGAATLACLLAYDGWVALSFIAGEVKNPQRNIPLALALGLGACIVIYLLANVAYLRAGLDAVALRSPLLSVVILICILGSVNGWAMTAPRLSFAQARDGLFFHRFGEIHPRFHTPSVAIVMQGVWAAALAVTGTYESTAAYAMFAAWLFYGLTALGVLILRRKYPARARPYRMFGYPVTLVLFVAVAFGFVLNTIVARPVAALTGTLMIATGVPAYFLWSKRLVR